MKWLPASGVVGKLDFPIFLGIRTCDLAAVDGGEGLGCVPILWACPCQAPSQHRPRPHRSQPTQRARVSGSVSDPPSQHPGDVTGQHMVPNVQHLRLC